MQGAYFQGHRTKVPRSDRYEDIKKALEEIPKVTFICIGCAKNPQLDRKTRKCTSCSKRRSSR